jgi:hypothetical protein
MADDNGVARIPLRRARVMKPLVSAGLLGLLPIPLMPQIAADAARDRSKTVDDHSRSCPCHVLPVAERVATEEELARLRGQVFRKSTEDC